MKQMIEYFYDLKIDNLFVEKDNYHFIYEGDDYYFVYYPKTYEELKDIIECSKELKQMGFDVHDIIINNKNSVITSIENSNYILLKVRCKDEEYDIIDIIDFNKKLRLKNTNNKNLYRNNWALLWSKKIDYIEKQLSEISVPDIINNSVDYYIGLCESAIYYVNKINLNVDKVQLNNITLSHKRIYIPNYKLNYLNPLSFIFDLEIRDVAEYIKSMFFAGKDAYLELITYLKSVKLSYYSYNMLYARLLFPSYYFDLYEKIIDKKIDSNCILKVIEKNKEYEVFLKKAYDAITPYAKLEKIDYIIY